MNQEQYGTATEKQQPPAQTPPAHHPADPSHKPHDPNKPPPTEKPEHEDEHDKEEKK